MQAKRNDLPKKEESEKNGEREGKGREGGVRIPRKLRTCIELELDEEREMREKGEDTEYGLVVLRLKTTRSTRLELSQGQPTPARPHGARWQYLSARSSGPFFS